MDHLGNFDHSCIEHGYHYLGGQELAAPELDGIDTPEQCQEKCLKETQCKWFTWGDDSKPKGCLLYTNKGSDKVTEGGKSNGATGPKYCPGKYV